VLHGYPVGLPGASRVYCVMHCWASAESITVFVGGLAGEMFDIEDVRGGQCDSEYKRTLRMTTLMNR